jgi:hypothetical protein
MTLLCPVCQTEMIATNNPELYVCPTKRFAYLLEFDLHRPYWDSAIQLGPSNEFYCQIYELPPYKIIIYNNPRQGQETKIQKLESVLFRVSDQHYEYKDIFSIATVLDMDWSQPHLIKERLRLLTIFS